MGFSRKNYEYVEGLLMKRRQESEYRAEKNSREVYTRSAELAEIDRITFS